MGEPPACESVDDVMARLGRLDDRGVARLFWAAAGAAAAARAAPPVRVDVAGDDPESSMWRQLLAGDDGSSAADVCDLLSRAGMARPRAVVLAVEVVVHRLQAEGVLPADEASDGLVDGAMCVVAGCLLARGHNGHHVTSVGGLRQASRSRSPRCC